jgi:demethylmenaquinone methyltransferase/2-methoxy-6-polyprenyl-1,4-benzoquinol methylase
MSAEDRASTGRDGAADDSTNDFVDFGFEDVPRAEKSGLVGAVFSDVAGRYDLMNDLMSLGVHRLWKAAFIDRLAPRPGMSLLDVAGGTGDIARGFCERIGSAGHGGVAKESRATICDINFAMTATGRDKAIDRPFPEGTGSVAVDWVCGNAEMLPIADMSVDAVTIAFGLRNVTDRTAALMEAYRVLRPGGRYLVLEFSTVSLPLLAELYDRYSFSVVPQIGAVVARNKDAYRYLVESIRNFPRPDHLLAELQTAGFGRVSYQLLSGGIAAIHSGWRL